MMTPAEEPLRLARLPYVHWKVARFWFFYSLLNATRYITLDRARGNVVPYGRMLVHTLASCLIWTLLSLLLFVVLDFTSSCRRWYRPVLEAAGVLPVWILASVVNGLEFVTLGPPQYALGIAALRKTILTHAFPTLLLVLLITGIARMMLWLDSEAKSRFRQEESRTALTQERLSAMAERLEPHFLFNTLTAIATLTSFDLPRAKRMIRGLQDLLAYAVGRDAPDSVTLGEELRFIEEYLRLQSIRFGDRLAFQIDTPQSLDDVMIPRLILQPVVENALRHGVQQIEEGGTIRIEASAAGKNLVVYVRNSDPGPQVSTSGAGVGVSSARARLRLLYGRKTRVTIERDRPRRIVSVKLTMPLLWSTATSSVDRPALRGSGATA